MSLGQISGVILMVVWVVLFHACGGSNSENSSPDSPSVTDDSEQGESERDEVDQAAGSPVDGRDSGNVDQNTNVSRFILNGSCLDVQYGNIFTNGVYDSEKNTCTWDGPSSYLTCPIEPGDCTLCLIQHETQCEQRDIYGNCIWRNYDLYNCMPAVNSTDIEPVAGG